MAERAYLVLSALGPDRPGLVAEVTHYITERGANVEDSRMAVLGGEFGIMVLLSASPERVERVAKEISALEGTTGMGVIARPTVGPDAGRQTPGQRFNVSASSLDHEGIVRAVSTALYRTGSNILSVETSSYNAPETGSPLFRMDVVVELPEGVSADQVRLTLEPIAQEENLDIDVSPR